MDPTKKRIRHVKRLAEAAVPGFAGETEKFFTVAHMPAEDDDCILIYLCS